MLLDRLFRSNKTQIPAEQTLAEASRVILDIARLERLPLLYMAERDGTGRGLYWFAENMIAIVGVRGKSPGADIPADLRSEETKGLRLDDDMTALRTSREEQPSFVDLKISRAQFLKYLDWVRTTW
jgi:hypothetical protein